MKHSSHYDTARLVIAFMIVALASSMFLIFYQNQDAIMDNNQFPTFISLATIGAGLLIGLFYLINNPQQSHKSSPVKPHKKKNSSK